MEAAANGDWSISLASSMKAYLTPSIRIQQPPCTESPRFAMENLEKQTGQGRLPASRQRGIAEGLCGGWGGCLCVWQWRI